MPSGSDVNVLTRSVAPAWWRSPRLWLSLIGITALLVLAINAPSMMPNAYILSVAIVILNYAVTATGWNFMGGFTGYISFGHAAYFGMGAYATGLLVAKAGMPHFTAYALGVLIATVIAIPVGIAALQMRDSSFVIVSIAIILIMVLVAQSWSSLTGGSYGLVVSRPFPELLRPEHHLVFYYLFLALLVITMLAWWLIDRSAFGLGLKAIREDEDKAQALGVWTFGYKLFAFILSAFFTAAAGGLYALWFGDLDPVFQFSILVGAYMVLMALVGGVRSLFGPLLGALVVGTALEYFKIEFGDTQFHLVATGLLLTIVVLFMPDGLIPAVQNLIRRHTKRDETSIREFTAEELAEQQKQAADEGSSTTSDRASMKASGV